jgi:hypothetical protein
MKKIYTGKKFGTVNLKTGADRAQAVFLLRTIKGVDSGRRKIKALKEAGFLREISPIDKRDSI